MVVVVGCVEGIRSWVVLVLFNLFIELTLCTYPLYTRKDKAKWTLDDGRVKRTLYSRLDQDQKPNRRCGCYLQISADDLVK